MMPLAKLLVLVNTFLGVGLLTWGVSVYTNRVDYMAKETGATALAKAEIDRLGKVIADASTSHSRRRAELATVEARRDERRAGYAKRLAEARNGRFREQPTIPDGYGGAFTNLDEVGKDVLAPNGQPLEGLKVLQDKFAVETRQIETLIGGQGLVPEERWQAIRAGQLSPDDIETLQTTFGTNDLRRLASELTSLINLENIALKKTRSVQANLADEATFLGDLRVNVGAELRLLQTREQQLQRRIQSLTNRN